MPLTEKTKQGGLLVVTGLAVAFVRHGLEHQWHRWESLEQFFASWFVHTAGLVVFFAVSVVAIGRFYEFFLGMKRKNDDFDELIYMVLMTVLIGSIFVFFVAHWVPSDDDF